MKFGFDIILKSEMDSNSFSSLGFFLYRLK